MAAAGVGGAAGASGGCCGSRRRRRGASRFPAIRLLLGLVPREETPARTPLWLILLRMVLAALVILALAHPLLNPQAPLAGNGPLVLVDR